MTTLEDKLKLLGACKPPLAFSAGKTLPEVWNTTDRGDWLMWLMQYCPVGDKVLTKAKLACVQLAVPYMGKWAAQVTPILNIISNWTDGLETDTAFNSAVAELGSIALGAANEVPKYPVYNNIEDMPDATAALLSVEYACIAARSLKISSMMTAECVGSAAAYASASGSREAAQLVAFSQCADAIRANVSVNLIHLP